MVGGEAKSDFWNQIKADVINIPIEIPRITEAASLGSAILAGLATKMFTNVDKDVENIVKVGAVYKPRKAVNKKYQRICEAYWRVYKCLEKAFNELE
jgi:sugar (pentulose or hexulose) kinase